MAFVRKKRVGSQIYYYLVESYRTPDTKAPRQNALMYLGKNPTVEDALADWSRRAQEKRREEERWSEERRTLLKELEEHRDDYEAEDAEEIMNYLKQLALLELVCHKDAKYWEQQVERLQALRNGTLSTYILDGRRHRD